jgi:serine/threonine-protein kinase
MSALPPAPATNETDSGERTPLPDPADRDFHELGATRVVEGPAEDAAVDAPAVPSAKPQAAGSLGDFQIIKKIGEGAMGAVYKARQISFDRDVALKVLFRHVANNPKLVERMYREGRAMARLDHPNIVQAYAVGEENGCHYVAMEYIDGQSMQKWLAQVGRLTVADAVQITLTCARALAYAHQQGMVHRDIKPDNILVTNQGAVKLADLGMVKTFDDDLGLTQTGHAVGTPWYMPMEQARNAKETDGRSDIYALGCTLYCFLTGTPPFAAGTIIEVVKAKEQGTFPPARRTNPEVPERLDLLLAKMAAKLPQYRHQSCAELIRDLEALGLAGETLTFLTQPVPARPATGPASVPAASSAGSSTAIPARSAAEANLWYVRLKGSDGKVVVRKFSTAQVQKMLAEGTLNPKAKASRLPDDGFRALATYRELQGIALSKSTKPAAVKATTQYRDLYRKIEEKERRREEHARAETSEWRYWLGVALKVGGGVLALVLLVLFFYYVGTGLGGK